MPDPTSAGDDSGHALILGEMRGQLREVVHGLNNLSGKFDGLSREVIGLGPLAGDIVDLKARVLKLEDERSRRAGAVGLVEWIIRHWPGVLGFLLLCGIVLRSNGKLGL